MDVLPILQTTGARYLFSSTESNGSNLFQILLEYIEDWDLSLANTLPDLAYAVDFDGGFESDYFMPWEPFLALGSSTRVNRPAAVSGSDTCMVPVHFRHDWSGEGGYAWSSPGSACPLAFIRQSWFYEPGQGIGNTSVFPYWGPEQRANALPAQGYDLHYRAPL